SLQSFTSAYRSPRYLPPFPTRRSSDLAHRACSWSELVRTCVMAKDRVRRSVRVTSCLSTWSAATISAAGCTRTSVRSWARNCSRSEEHTSELQSLRHLVCRLLLEKKKT